jgi:hypothetical protein
MSTRERRALQNAKYRVEVKDGEVLLSLSPWEAQALARILAEASPAHGKSALEKRRMRAISALIVRSLRPKRVTKRYQRVKRPPSDYQNVIDMEDVVRGTPPFQVLSVRDMREVYPQLEAKGMSAAQIAGRLYVSPRSVVRWRTAHAEKEKRDAEKREAWYC